mmetsp:Transcript_38092/g.92729  ORF Transcript_38092/g.92729 Transcript_38092/m.92729 type:complete len:233 (+) Transcript_38092:142-840(+)
MGRGPAGEGACTMEAKRCCRNCRSYVGLIEVAGFAYALTILGMASLARLFQQKPSAHSLPSSSRVTSTGPGISPPSMHWDFSDACSPQTHVEQGHESSRGEGGGCSISSCILGPPHRHTVKSGCCMLFGVKTVCLRISSHLTSPKPSKRRIRRRRKQHARDCYERAHPRASPSRAPTQCPLHGFLPVQTGCILHPFIGGLPLSAPPSSLPTYSGSTRTHGPKSGVFRWSTGC